MIFCIEFSQIFWKGGTAPSKAPLLPFRLLLQISASATGGKCNGYF